MLCASGALRGGAGLVTIYAPEDIQPILAVAAPPEVMVRPVKSYAEVFEEKHDVLASGRAWAKAARNNPATRRKCRSPMVVDADGLNIVAEHERTLLDRCAGPRLLTPHPGEMARLFPEAKELSRPRNGHQIYRAIFGARFPVTLLLKGSRTIVHEHGKPASYNTTGNPGMGTGGMGDVLTGVCAALIGQNLSPMTPRAPAHGCAAARRRSRCRPEESLAAMDVVSPSDAFTQLRAGCLYQASRHSHFPCSPEWSRFTPPPLGDL